MSSPTPAVTYFEGYLWDPPRAKEAIRECARIAHENGREMSMTLSDSFCVHRYRGEFLDLMRSGTVDIVFANRDEALALYETDDFEKALTLIARDCKIAAVTMSEEARSSSRATSAVSRGHDDRRASSIRPAPAISMPPASCFGYTHGRTLADCGKLGSLAAGIVIEQIGPRPMIRSRRQRRKPVCC